MLFWLFSQDLSLYFLISYIQGNIAMVVTLDVLPLKGCIAIDNSETDTVPCRQGFFGISTVQDLSERGPVQLTAKGSLIKIFEISKLYIYHALINALSAHMLHINLNMIFYTHEEHSPTKTIYI